MNIATNQLPPLSSSAPTGTNFLRDIKPPIEIPSGWAWIAWLLGGLVLALLLFFTWRYWQRRRLFVPPVPVIPPHVRARQKLQDALAFLSNPREFCILVSDAIRWYLEERFNFRAPERTTEEFLHELQSTALLSAAQKQSLADFLQRCDLVKFAKYEPRESELTDLHASALRLVDETEPRPVSTMDLPKHPTAPIEPPTSSVVKTSTGA